MTEMELRMGFVQFMLADAGAIEGGTVHREAVVSYNNQGKPPRGYFLQMKDPWCAGYTSAKALQYGLDGIIPVEVSCGYLIEKAKKMGIWKEADNYEPLPGDILMYDWEDSGKGDNTGSPNHVGYVIGVADGYMSIWEGNMGRSGYPDHVGVRPLKHNHKYIRGFITPDFAAEAKRRTELEQKPENDVEKEETDMVRYKSLDEIREKAGYAAETVEKLLGGDILLGKGGSDGLALTEDMVRTLVILDRLGLIPDPKV